MADENKGYGQQDPSDSSNDYNKDIFTIKRVLANVRTSIPVKVIAVTTKGDLAPVGMVDVQPLVKQLDGAGNATSHGTVFSVPYMRLQGGKNAVIIDPEVGDIGDMLCADRDISAVVSTKAEAPPSSGRRHAFADGVYIGGILGDTPEQYVRFHADGIDFVDKNGNSYKSSGDGIAITPAAGKPVVINGPLQLSGSIAAVGGGTYAGNLHTTGTITGDTDVVSAGKSFNGHEHTYLKPSTGATTPTPTSTPI